MARYRLLQFRFSIATLLIMIGIVAASLSAMSHGYKRERTLLDPLVLDTQEINSFFDTPADEIKIGSDGYILVKWVGPSLLESPMRALGLPWFERAVTVSIGSDKNMSLKSLRDLRSLKHLSLLRIGNPHKTRREYHELRNYFGGHPRFEWSPFLRKEL